MAEVHGDYIEGLEEDIWGILEYFGRDFEEPKKNPAHRLECPGNRMMAVPSGVSPSSTAVNESPVHPLKLS
jgi:integrase